MRCLRLTVAIVLVSALLSCKDDERTEGSAGAENSPAEPVTVPPENLDGTPWGEIVSLKSALWSLLETRTDDLDSLVAEIDGWYLANDSRLRAACADASGRPIREPAAWNVQLDAFSRWQVEVAQPRAGRLTRVLRDPRLIERLHLFDQRCLDAASVAAPTERGTPEDPWARYVILRREIHALINKGIPHPEPTLRKGEAWYEDHDDEIREICERMSALASSPENAERIAKYTTYLQAEGQRTVEMLVAKIPAVVDNPGIARDLFDLMNRFDQICADGSASSR